MDKIGRPLLVGGGTEDFALAELIKQEILESNRAILSKYLVGSGLDEAYLSILSKFYSGELLVQKAYAYFSISRIEESLVQCMLAFLLDSKLKEILDSGSFPDAKGKSYEDPIFGELQQAIRQYESFLGITAVTFNLDRLEPDRYEITITYTVIMKMTKHNYVYPYSLCGTQVSFV